MPPTKREQADSETHAVRILKERLKRYAEEAAALTAVTGTKWSVGAYMRYAAEQMLGKHPMLTKPGE